MSRDHQELIALGSRTAKNGFKNEYDVIDKFNNWPNDEEVKRWFEILNVNIKFIERVDASKFIGHYKPDVLVKVKFTNDVSLRNIYISIKLVSNLRGYNQIDKRWSDDYYKLWNFPNDVLSTLKLFTGEVPHSVSGAERPNRLFLNEVGKEESEKVINFFRDNRVRVLSDILRGNDYPAQFMLVAQKNVANPRWILKSMYEVINICNQGAVELSPKNSLRIGKVTLQRKGGDGGRNSANMLQFKFNPICLFDL
jgi:hypothetical protein